MVTEETIRRRDQKRKYNLKNKDRIYEQRKNYREKNKEKISRQIKKWREENKLKIAERRKKSDREYYQKHKEELKSKINLRYKNNRKKIIEYQKKFTINNKDKIRKYKKEYRKKNSDKLSIIAREYYQSHKRERSEYLKSKRKNDATFAIVSRLRGRLREAFKLYSEKGKLKPADEYGINYSDIIKHLEPFPDDRENYHIDHIKPLCSFDFNDAEQIKKAFAPENHQWLTVKENLSKGGRF